VENSADFSVKSGLPDAAVSESKVVIQDESIDKSDTSNLMPAGPASGG